MAALLDAIAAFRAALAAFDPEVCSAADCAVAAEALARAEKLSAAKRVLASARAVKTGAYAGRGDRDGPAWLARQTGTSVREAREALDVAERLDECPETRQAVLDGDVSWSQAKTITDAQAEMPGAEGPLLDAARHGSLSEVRDAARKHRQTHTPVEALHDRQRRARTCRTFVDELGMVGVQARLTPEVGLPLLRRLERDTASRYRQARRQQLNESWEACQADALAALCAEGGNGKPRRAKVELVIVCDLNAWRRGHAHPGEPCHLLGGGPIPVRVARELSTDAFLKAVLHDGVDIRVVKHFRPDRYRQAELQTALDMGSPPDFEGAACADCGSRHHLEWDHLDPVSNGGPTEYANLQPRCWKDHTRKTEADRQNGLLGPTPPASTGRKPRRPAPPRPPTPSPRDGPSP